MRLPKNILSGTVEPPEFYLCQVDKSIISGLNVIEPSGVFKFNQYSEITFSISRFYQHPVSGEMVVNPVYDYVEALRLIYIVNFGYFQIQEANIVSDGIYERKECVCYSLEYELTQKYLDLFTINYGTDESIDGVRLYNFADISHSLIHLVLEKAVGWKVGHIDISLQDKQRSFEVDHQTIYDFLKNDLSDAFQCVVDFDTYNRTVNIYESESAGSETNILVSMDTIAKDVEVSYSADDIKTCLYVYGADDLDVRQVNLGLEYITNIDFYTTPQWLGAELCDAYEAYCKLVEDNREIFSNLMKQWSSLYDQYSELYNKIPDYEENYDDKIPTVYSKSDLPAPSEKNVYMIYRVVEGAATWYYICKSEKVDDVLTYRWVLDVDNISSFYTFPTPSIEYVGGVYKVYNADSTQGVLYYICESYQMNNWTTGYRWVLAESDYGINMLKEKEACYLDIQEIQVSAGFAEKTSDQYDRYLENYEKLIEIQSLLKEEESKAATLKEQLDSIMAQMNAISKIIDLKNNFTEEQIVILNSFIREDEYTNDNILISEYDDDATIMDTQQELLEAAQKELQKISQPQLSFQMSLANILAIPEFEPVVNDFKCGNFVKVELRPDYVVKTQILEVNINFDDMSDFSVTFGNLSSLYSQVDVHASLMSQAISAGKQVAESGSYWKKGANTANSINSRIETGLIDANTSIKSTENQAISWDSHGFHLRKYADESKSTYEDDQIWMNNEKIVFTDDNWRTAKMAIGKVFDNNLTTDHNPLGEAYGIIAPNIVGTLLAGKNLVIESKNEDGTISLFKVDKTGAKLYNSTFLMEKDNGGKIVINPDYGIVAGDKDFTYATNSDGSINIPRDDTGFPRNSSFFLDIDSGDAYFSGTIFADGNSVISGSLSSATGEFRGKVTAYEGDIGRWIIEDGYLHSGENATYVGLSSNNRKPTVNESNEIIIHDGESAIKDENGNTILLSTDYAIWAGNDEPSAAPFSVKRDGTVTMKQGLIKCGINVNDNFIVKADGTVSIAKSLNIGDGKFVVNSNGALTIGKASITSPVIKGGQFKDPNEVNWITMENRDYGDNLTLGFLEHYYSGYSTQTPVTRIGYACLNVGYTNPHVWGLSALGNNILQYVDGLKTTQPKGKWDFSDAEVDWGNNAPSGGTATAVFG